MANEYAVNRDDLVSVADAIRAKGETQEALTFPADFVAAIGAIDVGKNGATLVVTCPAGVTVTASKDDTVYTQTADGEGVAEFIGITTGTWTVTITDGSQTAQKTVTIHADYETSITFFSATIHITYPSGLVCTATDGVTTLRAPDTSGVWACIVPNAGTWTVTVEQKGWTDTAEITESGQTVQVALDQLYIYRNGVLKYTILDKYQKDWINAGGKLTGHMNSSVSGNALILGFKEKLGDVDSISIRAKVINKDTGYYDAFVSRYNTWPDSYNNKLAAVNIDSAEEKTYSVDLSGISGDIYLWMAWSAVHKNADVEIYEIRGV